MTTARIVKYIDNESGDMSGFRVFLETDGVEIEVENTIDSNITLGNAGDMQKGYIEFYLSENVTIEKKRSFTHNKRYLTRDWQVVKYDGTQDVVARVYVHKPGRFDQNEEVWVVGPDSKKYKTKPKAHNYGHKGERWLMVRHTDLPDGMKCGPKSSRRN